AECRGSEEDCRLEVALEHLLDLDLGQLDFLLDQADRVFDRQPGKIDQGTRAVAVGRRPRRFRGRSPGSRIHQTPSFLPVAPSRAMLERKHYSVPVNLT